MKVLILGNGWLGKQLQNYLNNQNISSLVTNRDVFNLGINSFTKEMMNVDYVVSFITPQNKSGTSLKELWNKQFELNPNLTDKSIIHFSSISIYGDQDGLVDEGTEKRPDTSNGEELLEFEKFVSHFPSQLVFHAGGLIGPGRLPSNFFKKTKSLKMSKSPINLLLSEDALIALLEVIKQGIKGDSYNLVSTDHPLKEEFYPRFYDFSFELDGLGQNGKVISMEKFFQDYNIRFDSTPLIERLKHL